MDRLFIGIGAISGFLSVAAGAFAPTRCKSACRPTCWMSSHRSPVLQMFHALGLVLVGLCVARAPHPALTTAGIAFTAGTVLFSGSLYALALSGVRILGAVTPIGGLAFLCGSIALAWAAFRG